ncbi:hypothetical protein MHU86_20884 [Fragilaria crotonensis]|nr:hypothetical protein MHU86_20884 [Fragilaria crotonensis]
MEVVFDILVDVMDCQNAPASDQQEVANLGGAESAKSVHGVELACLQVGESLNLVLLIDFAEDVHPRLRQGDGREYRWCRRHGGALKWVRGEIRPILISILELLPLSFYSRIAVVFVDPANCEIFDCVTSRPSVVLSLRISQAGTEGEVNRFYASSSDATGKRGRRLKQKLVKTFAYIISPPHTFIDYFQMSRGLAPTCCKAFAVVMRLLYDDKYLHLPDALNLKTIVELH